MAETVIRGAQRILGTLPDGTGDAGLTIDSTTKQVGSATSLSGPPGTAGKSVLNGTTNPTTQGTDGDFYINTSTWTIFGPKTGGLWGSGTSIVGAVGATGAAGSNGTNGYSVLSGSGVPSVGTGVNGDFYINVTAYDIYGPKAGGVWGTATSLIGPTGATGATGSIGLTGADGQSQYLWIAYADDLVGTNFTLTFDISKDYTAWLVTNDAATPVQSDFDSLWTKYKGDGDRWATESTTSVTIGTGTKNFTVELDLAYTTGQNVVIAQNGTVANRMEGKVISYNTITGALSVDVTTTAGAGTIADWLINLQGFAEADPLYTGASPSNITVGGLVSGTTLTGMTLSEILEDILVAYLSPTFSAFAISGQATTVEVGTTISGSKTFTWTTTNPSNVSPNTIDIDDITGATSLVANTADDSIEAGVAVGSITKTSPDSHIWRITGTNTNAVNFTRDFTVSWQWRRYHGTSANTILTEAQIEGLANNALNSGFAGTYTFSAGDYKFLAWADSLGSPASGIGFRDLATNLAVDMATVADHASFSNVQNGWYYALVSVTNTGGVTTNYRLYRTRNTLGGSITIQVTA